MRKKGRVLFGLGVSVSLVVLLLILPAALVAAAPSADAAAGKALFQTNCSSCHGADASGGLKIGNATSANLQWGRIGPAGTNYKGDAALISRAILAGKDESGADLDAVMPRWQGKLTDAQVSDIISFLQTTGGAAAPAAAATTAPVAASSAAAPASTSNTAAQAATNTAPQAAPAKLPNTGDNGIANLLTLGLLSGVVLLAGGLLLKRRSSPNL